MGNEPSTDGRGNASDAGDDSRDADLDDLESEAVEDLEVDEDAEDVAGGDMCSATPSICHTL